MSVEPFDLAVAGGGMAGLAAAVHAAAEGVRVVVLERGEPGGRVREMARVEAVPGFPVGLTGGELAERAAAQAARFGAELRTGAEVVGLRAERELRTLAVAGGAAVVARAVLVATGTESAAAPVPGSVELAGSGVYFGLPDALPEALRSRDVFVAGEPGAAAEAGLRLARHCRRVVLLLAAPLPAELAGRLRAAANVAVRPHAEVVEAVGVERVEALLLRDRRTGRTAVRNAAALFVVGAGRPRTGWLGGALALDARGFVSTGVSPRRGAGAWDAWPLARVPFPLETSLPGVFAAGGARCGAGRSLAGRVEEGTAAARQAGAYLEGTRAVPGAGASHGHEEDGHE